MLLLNVITKLSPDERFRIIENDLFQSDFDIFG